ncbi:hypothetical protein CPB86DRAFT_808268 [Serendipita vermifera]|nr:hypothetical protein CPB86DRAFT_808268 [Serendipita vermifera]
MSTHFPGGSTKTLPNSVGRHDGHADSHLNCVALRHGWSRAFSISPEELSVLDYDALEAVLEVNTLKLRPMALRIYVENPVDSGNWSKVRHWKHDGSLQSTLVQQFFERRRVEGLITRLEIRDGADRQSEDAVSLMTVGSRILHGHGRVKTDDGKSNTSSPRTGWFGLSRNNSTKSRGARTIGTNTDGEEEEHAAADEVPPPPPAKPSFFSLLRPHPKISNQPYERRSIFDFFRAKLQGAPFISGNKKGKNRIPTPDAAPENPQDQQLMEVEQLRKRGWIPPGLVRRQRSLKERLRAEGLPADGGGGSKNPFFGSSRTFMSRADRKKAHDAAASGREGDDPFGDNAGINLEGPDEITEQEIDDFFEVERSSSVIELSNTPSKEKPWTRFKPAKDRKGKSKARAAAAAAAAPAKGTLGGGADIVQKPKDAFPDSPHHRAAEAPEITPDID